MDYKKEIIKTIDSISGRYAPYNVFSDWIEVCAISIQNACCLIHDRVWHQREQLYLDIVKKYTEEELNGFTKMLTHLCDALTEEMTDVLGQIYMEAGMGNKNTGQVFTPFNLSQMSAEMVLPKELPETGHISLTEPSCGGGCMVIAACRVLHERGFDFQRRLDVVAQDLDWKGVYMTYLQLSLIGCRAIVVQGDTLADPYRDGYPRDRVMRTPAMMGMII
jgi:type I restriction-modification system DNA methylase subunit